MSFSLLSPSSHNMFKMMFTILLKRLLKLIKMIQDQVESISNEIPEAQNEDENRDHEEHTEDENLDHEEHTEDDLAPRNKTNLTPVTVFSQTQPSQNL